MNPINILGKIISTGGPHEVYRNNNVPRQAYSKSVYSWIDKCSISYFYDINKSDSLKIILPDSKPTPASLFNYINKLPKEIKNIELIVYGIESFNNLGKLFSTINLNREVVVSGSGKTLKDAPKVTSSWPDNVKLENKYIGNHSDETFDCWSLNLSDEEFNIVKNHCDKKTETRMIQLREIVKNFYYYLKQKYPDFDNKTALEKTDIVYQWCAHNIGYDWDAIEFHEGLARKKANHDYVDDAIETFRRKKGVCTGRSALMKNLLNNYYMRVPCYTVSGKVPHGEGHSWNEIVINGKRYNYDLSYGVRKNEKVNYTNLFHIDYDNCKDILPSPINSSKRVPEQAPRRPVQQPLPARKPEQAPRRPVQQPLPARKPEQAPRRPVQQPLPARKPEQAPRRPVQQPLPPRVATGDTQKKKLPFNHNNGINKIAHEKPTPVKTPTNVMKMIMKYQGGKK